MNRWQKITGIIAFALIVVYELLAWVNAYVDMKYIVEPDEDNFMVDILYFCSLMLPNTLAHNVIQNQRESQSNTKTCYLWN